MRQSSANNTSFAGFGIFLKMSLMVNENIVTLITDSVGVHFRFGEFLIVQREL